MHNVDSFVWHLEKILLCQIMWTNPLPFLPFAMLWDLRLLFLRTKLCVPCNQMCCFLLSSHFNVAASRGFLKGKACLSYQVVLSFLNLCLLPFPSGKKSKSATIHCISTH